MKANGAISAEAEEAKKFFIVLGGREGALHAAIMANNEEASKLLIQETPEAINTINEHGATPLYMAVSRGNKEICKLLLPLMRPETINAVTKIGWTVLHGAAALGSEEICKLLIPHMTLESINAVETEHNDTALHKAAQNGLTNVAWTLLDHGANPTICNKQELTPAAVAVKAGHPVTGAVIHAGPEMSIKLLNLMSFYEHKDRESVNNALSKSEVLEQHNVCSIDLEVAEVGLSGQSIVKYCE